MKALLLDLVKQLFKIFIHPWSFLQFQYTILNINTLVIVPRFIVGAIYIAKAIEVDWIEVVIEDFYNLY